MDVLVKYHILQPIIAFFITFIYARALGKTQIGQLCFYDYVSGITIGSLAAFIAVEDIDKTFPGIISLSIFSFLTYLTAYITLKSRKFRKIIASSPTIVVSKGKIMKQNMASMRYDLDQLIAQLREKGIFHLADVEYAILENDGELSVLRKDEDVNRKYQGLETELIMDGEIIYESLAILNKTEDWLISELKKRGVRDIDEVIYSSIDEKGNIYVCQRH